jgi:hypothetical protein
MSIDPHPPRAWAILLTGCEGTRLQRLTVTKLSSKNGTVLISGRTRAANPSPCGELHKRLRQRVLDKMEANLATDLDLGALAAESGYA